METQLKDYNTRTSQTLQQNQLYEGSSVPMQIGQQQLTRLQHSGLPQHGVGQKPKAPEKMPKARTLALARTLKRWLAVVSIMGFGTFSGLVALHQVGTTASQSTQTSSGSSTTTPTTTSSSSTSTSSSSSQNSNGFFNQGGNNFGSSTSSSTSVSGSSVS